MRRDSVLSLIIVVFLLVMPIAKADFEIWTERSGLFTIGRPEEVKIYVKNLEPSTDSYTITIDNVEATYRTQDVSHLLHVELKSGRINNLQQNEVGSTIATVVILGKIDSGSITFGATSDLDSTLKEYTIDITGGLPSALDEFGLIGVFVFLISSLYLFIKFRN